MKTYRRHKFILTSNQYWGPIKINARQIPSDVSISNRLRVQFFIFNQIVTINNNY
jgi:hypothetical protein